MAAGVFLLALTIWFLPPSYESPIRRAIRNTVLRPFLTAQATLAARRTRGIDVNEVRAQRDSLVAVVSAQAPLADENRRLRELLGLRARALGDFVAAEVVRLGIGPAESTFMLNVGTAEGVSVNAPVITPEGLLGKVIEVSEHMAQAMDWTHPDFAASAMTADGAAQGMAEPRRGDFREEDLLVLTGAPFHTDIQQGTPVVTTGRGGVFPRGIPIGVVLGIEEADTGWRKSYLMRPVIRPEAATHVLVGTSKTIGSDLSYLWHVAPQVQLVDTTVTRTPAQADTLRPVPPDTTAAITTTNGD